MSAVSSCRLETSRAVLACRLAFAGLAALACGPEVESTAGDAATSEPSDDGSTSTGADGFAEACDLGPGWIGDEILRARCSDWLERHCAQRMLSDCTEAFVTTDQQQLNCFVADVVVADGRSCGPREARCLPGNETEIYKCNACGVEDKNLEALELAAGTREIVIMDDEQCGTSVFIAGYAQCSSDDMACACGCGS